MPSNISAKTTVLVLLTLGTLVHTLGGDLHSPEDPAGFVLVIGAHRLTKTAALVMSTVAFVGNVLRTTIARVKRFSTGTKARNTMNYKCLVPRALHL
ncbi:MAG: hypothetical protein ACXVI3_02085 [Halobacteriota archaeon]